MSIRRPLSLALLFPMLACAEPEPEPAVTIVRSAAKVVDIDPRRSLAVTEEVILARFSFARVMEQLVNQSGIPGLTPLALYRQWWDIMNPTPGVVGSGPHCDDLDDDQGNFNGFPYTCRQAPSEGVQAEEDPFSDASAAQAYLPIGLFNRFDLAPQDGAHCGEHRIVYARRSGISDDNNRNLIIFEAVLPNPFPQQGIKGCRKIAELWAGLSDEADPEKRADRLEHFYFDGLAPFPPVVHVDHYGGGTAGTGQVRTNQFLQGTASPRVWSLREFKLMKALAGTVLRFEPVTDKVNPFGPLFAPDASHARKDEFWAFFPTQVASLAAANLADINYVVPDQFNTAQSQASGSTENRYGQLFGSEPSALRAGITDALNGHPDLSPEHIVLRAQALSCAGCHRLNNDIDVGGGITWPASLGFTHVSEQAPEVVGGLSRFRLSPALVNAFLPHRAQILADFVNKDKVPKKNPIGGRATH